MNACVLCLFSPVQLFATSLHGILRVRILERVPCPLPGGLPNPGTELVSPSLQVVSLLLSHWGSLQTSMNNLSLFSVGHISNILLTSLNLASFFFFKHLNTFTCYWTYQAKDLQPPNTWRFHLTWSYYQHLPISTHIYAVCVCVSQSCLTLCDPMDHTPPGSSVRGILQARILEWAAIPICRGSSWPRDWTCVSCIAGRFFTK